MIEQDAGQEVRRIVADGEAAGLHLRALGGVAVSLACPSAATHPRLKRAYADIDLVGLTREGPRLGAFFSQLGYIPDQRFNALHGLTRLLFYNPADGGHVDVFLDRFQMCHTIDLRRRLLEGYLTLTLADLMITKLQIVEMNLKDMQDCLAILLDHELGPESLGQLDQNYLAGLTSRDWGLFTTLGDNLEKVKEHSADFLLSDEAYTVAARVDGILQAMQSAPKSLGWRARSRIGRRLEWYDVPDEVRR
jgi:hypothetical protein